MLHQSIENIYAVKKRIVSLVPSITELLYSLGLDDEVIGITKFCVHPPQWKKEKKIIGGTKNFRLDAIRDLRPDLIIASKEENIEKQINALAEEFDVYLTDVKTLTDALSLIAEIGKITGKTDEAGFLSEKIGKEFVALTNFVSRKKLTPSVIYLIWQEPLMTVGGDTFISAMMDAAGFKNLIREEKRYPVLPLEDIRKMKPDIVFLSSEPFPFTHKHREEMQAHFPDIKIVLVDGEMFSWYGSRMAFFPNYIMETLQL